MIKSKLEEYVGKVVTITMFVGDTYTGKLRKTGTEDLRSVNTYLYCVPDRYFIEADGVPLICFRCSHVKKIAEVANGEKT